MAMLLTCNVLRRIKILREHVFAMELLVGGFVDESRMRSAARQGPANFTQARQMYGQMGILDRNKVSLGHLSDMMGRRGRRPLVSEPSAIVTLPPCYMHTVAAGRTTPSARCTTLQYPRLITSCPPLDALSPLSSHQPGLTAILREQHTSHSGNNNILASTRTPAEESSHTKSKSMGKTALIGQCDELLIGCMTIRFANDELSVPNRP